MPAAVRPEGSSRSRSISNTLGSRSNSLVLCQGPDSFSVPIKQRLLDLAQHIFGKKVLASSKRTETFWILDIASNTATRLGSDEQFAGAGSRWHGSPEGRYGYTVPSTAGDSWSSMLARTHWDQELVEWQMADGRYKYN